MQKKIEKHIGIIRKNYKSSLSKVIITFLNWRRMYPTMTPGEDRIRVSARIPKELDARIRQHYPSAAQAINEALELLAETKENKMAPDGTNGASNNAGVFTAPGGANTANNGANSDPSNGAGGYVARIGDMERQIEFLKGQITIKDQQLDKQAFSLQSVIQENSRLNVKLCHLPKIE